MGKTGNKRSDRRGTCMKHDRDRTEKQEDRHITPVLHQSLIRIIIIIHGWECKILVLLKNKKVSSRGPLS